MTGASVNGGRKSMKEAEHGNQKQGKDPLKKKLKKKNLQN